MQTLRSAGRDTDLVAAERDVLAAFRQQEAALIKLSATQRINRIQLYLALSGSFEAAPAAGAASKALAERGGAPAP